MFQTRKTVVAKDKVMLENIKRDIRNQLNKKGVIISGINMDMNSENISLSLHIQCFPSPTQLLSQRRY